MRVWIEPEPVTVPAALSIFIGGHPLVAEMLVRRAITGVAAARAFLDPDAYTPAPPGDMPGMARAADRLEAAIERGERICVWGDFDVDGQTATTLLVSTLRDLGGDVIYHIPVRATESHGVKVPWLQQELDRGARVVLTCDTGSDACEAVTCANVYGVDVIITDHHELPAVLPDAHTIVNPHLLSAGHPLETLPGVGVAYKLGEELYRRAGRAGDIEQHLDLVALGIVADLADQIGDARYLLQRGLVALRNTQRLGLREMMKLASLVPAQLNEEHIGFGLAPRLNALGRLDDANVSVEFLTTRDLTRARILASELEALNARRKILGDQVFQAAQAQIERDPALMDHAALVLANPAWPVGVVGIVANRLAELYGRPAILISTPPDQMGRGSARSIEGVHITDAIASQQDLLESFGGHAMAAGLSIDPDKIAEFRRGLSRVVAAQLGEALGRPTLRIDGYVPLSDLSLDLVADLERLAPFGPGNSAPVLATRDLRITAKRTVGQDRKHLVVTVEDEAGAEREVVWWRWGGEPLPEGRFDLAYTVRTNDFRGQQYLQIVWRDAREAVPPAEEERPKPAPLEIVDYRREPHPTTLLKPLLARDDVQVWREGPEASDVPGQRRLELRPGSYLVIWTAPPGSEELQTVLKRVRPSTVYLFGVDPGLTQEDAFLRFLAGLVKYALAVTDGRVEVPVLAAITANREAAVRLGLAWLEARGFIAVLAEDGDVLRLGPGEQKASAHAEQITAQLRSLLEEVKAYRQHFVRADTEVLRATMLGSGQ